MNISRIEYTGVTTGLVGATASASTLAITPDLILTYISIICMLISMFSTIVISVIKIIGLVKEKKYKEAEKEVNELAHNVSKQSNDIVDKIEDTKEVKK